MNTAATGAPAIEPIVIPKDKRESLSLSVDNYKGRDLLSCRVWYSAGEGEALRPGKDGFAIAIERLPEIIVGLQRLAAAAKAEGLL